MLSTILREAGHITESDTERALEYQRLHGGFIGEALVALGIVRREEVDWALASQFDLPYIFPDPDAVDAEVAALVPPDWALMHLAVPIMRAGNVLTVVVADPLQRDVIEELQEATGLEVELALAAPARIRGLIRALYDRPEDRTPQQLGPHSLREFIVRATEAGAERMGISVRGADAWGWYVPAHSRATNRPDTFQRLPLAGEWEGELEHMLSPPPEPGDEAASPGRRTWAATLASGGARIPLDVEILEGEGGAEYLFRIGEPDHAGRAGKPNRAMVPAALVAELRLLARARYARIAVRSEDPELVREVLASLPMLVLDEPVRAVHLSDRQGAAAAGVYTLMPTPDEAFSAALEAYAFDAVTVDLPLDLFPVRRFVELAPLAFAYLRGVEDDREVAEAGCDWVLDISGNDRGGLGGWELRPVRI